MLTNLDAKLENAGVDPRIPWLATAVCGSHFTAGQPESVYLTWLTLLVFLCFYVLSRVPRWTVYWLTIGLFVLQVIVLYKNI